MNKRARKLHVQEVTNRNKSTTFGTPRLIIFEIQVQFKDARFISELQGYSL